MNYAHHFNPNVTPQSEQADPRQVENSAGGFSFQLDAWKRLDRFIILGTEGGTYYASERKLTRDNAKVILECLALDARRTVETIASLSESGRAPKNDAAIFALALACSDKTSSTMALQSGAVQRVCRIGTHLFQFVSAVDSMRGWGPALRKAVARWYSSKTPDQLCYQLAKYQQREGWSHRDLLRLSHPRATNRCDTNENLDKDEAERQAIYRWLTNASLGSRDVSGSERAKRSARIYPPVSFRHEELPLPAFLAAFEELKAADEKRTIALIREHGFTHEMIATKHKNSADVWEALLEKMPMTALIRNLAKMTAVGLLKPMAAAVVKATEKLGDEAAIRKARVHPIQMLSALMVYRQGHGDKGSLTWSPVAQIIDALDAGFYSAFGAIEPSGKRTLLAIDVSGSMDGGVIAGVPGLTPRMGAAAMAMVTARVEKNWACVGFSAPSGGGYGGKWDSGRAGLTDIPITPRQRLDDVIATMSRVPMGGTDCALPMLWAEHQKYDIDSFFVYTDSETWANPEIHPHQALAKYRNKSGIAARLCVVGLVSNQFTIADPSDAGMLDVVGFDSSAPSVMSEFSRAQ